MINFSMLKLSRWLITMVVLLCWTTRLSAQFTEHFEDEIVGSNTFSGGGVSFSTTNPLNISTFTDGGSNGVGDDHFLDANGTGNVGRVTILTPDRVFQMQSVDVWLSADAGATTSAGSLTFRGVLAQGGTQEVTFSTMPVDANDWLEFSFTGTALEGVELTALEFIIDETKNYLALDDFEFTAFNTSVVNVSVDDVTLVEGDAGNTTFTFTITRTNNSTDFSLTVATANGTALAGSDYEAISPTSLNFTAGGALSQTVDVNVFGDVNVEATETFFLHLSAPTNGAVIADSQGVGTITDDDTVCETFEDEEVASPSFSESGLSFSTTGELTVARTMGEGSSGSDFFLDTGVGDGATSGSAGEIVLTTANQAFELLQFDLWTSADDGATRAAGMVTLRGTKTDLSTITHTFNVAASGTFTWEEDISLVGTPFDGVHLSKVEVLLGEGLNYLAIDDFKFAVFADDQVLVNINDVSQAEGDAGTTDFTFTISRTNNLTAFSVTANTLMGGSNNLATAGGDYVSLQPTVLDFMAGGALTQTVTVVVNADIESEFPETFLVDLSAPTNGALISDGEGLGTILDDDTTCETFEDEGMADLMAFSEDGLNFTSTGHLQTGFFAGGGSTGSDYYLESNADNAPYAQGSSVGSFQLTNAETGFEILRLDLWLSNDADVNTAEIDQLRFVGTPLDGSPAVSVEVSSTSAGNWSENISFVGTDLESVVLQSLELVLQGTSNYVALDNICLVEVPICDPVAFIAPVDLCVDAGLQVGLNGGTPSGGLYSGPGVTDSGDGVTYSFDPALAGSGTHTLVYTYTDERGCSGTATDDMVVFDLPEVFFSSSLETVNVVAGLQTGLGGGLPAGGIYSGPGVADDGNGSTFSFDPEIAGVGTVSVNYTFANENGCANSATDDIIVTDQVLPADECTDASDISMLFGQTHLEPQVSTVWDNTNYTTSMQDPTSGYECFGEPDGGGASPSLERTIWYSFTGDGNRYRIRTIQCGVDLADYAFDTQLVVYEGDCDNLLALACNEDESLADTLFNADVSITTEVGETYFVMVDGFGPDFASSGQYCLEVTNLTPVNTTELSVSELEVYPSPATDWLQFANELVSQVDIFDLQGRLLWSAQVQDQKIDVSNLPSGLLVLRVQTPRGVISAKIIKE